MHAYVCMLPNWPGDTLVYGVDNGTVSHVMRTRESDELISSYLCTIYVNVQLVNIIIVFVHLVIYRP